MGAVVTVYGNLLYNKYGSNFAVITGESQKEKLKSNGFKLNIKIFYPQEDHLKLMSYFSPDGKTSMLQDIEAKRKT